MNVARKKKLFDGKYEILSVIGRGSTSVVYKALDTTESYSELALKVLVNRKSLSFSAGRLRTEALALASSRHKNVVQVFDFRCADNISYLVLEHSPYSDLRAYTEKRGETLSHKTGRSFYLQAAAGLMSVHQAGLVHCDITPDNMLVMENQELRLADFGEATFVEEPFSLSNLLEGLQTRKYLAPEVLGGGRCDRRSDIYSLGVSFYELFAGKHPFATISEERFTEVQKVSVITDIRSLVKDIPEDLAEIIMKSLSYQASDRYQNALELYEAIAVSQLHRREKGSLRLVTKTTISESETNVLASNSPSSKEELALENLDRLLECEVEEEDLHSQEQEQEQEQVTKERLIEEPATNSHEPEMAEEKGFDPEYLASKEKIFYLLDALDETVAMFGGDSFSSDSKKRLESFEDEPQQELATSSLKEKSLESLLEQAPASLDSDIELGNVAYDSFQTPKSMYSKSPQPQWSSDGHELSSSSQKLNHFQTANSKKWLTLVQKGHFGTFFRSFLSLSLLLCVIHFGFEMLEGTSFMERLVLIAGTTLTSLQR